jgi:hypothetical protein
MILIMKKISLRLYQAFMNDDATWAMILLMPCCDCDPRPEVPGLRRALCSARQHVRTWPLRRVAQASRLKADVTHNRVVSGKSPRRPWAFFSPTSALERPHDRAQRRPWAQSGRKRNGGYGAV